MPYLVIPQYGKRTWRTVMVAVAGFWAVEWLTNWNRLSGTLDATGNPVTTYPHQYPPGWSTALFAGWLALGLSVFAVRWSRNRRLACTPGSVPRGIPRPGVKGFEWLARNHLGAIDMSRYTDQQWAHTGLPYCPTHMRGPQDARFGVVTDEFGNPFAVDPCPCGQILNQARLAIAARAEDREAFTTAAVAGAIGLVAGVTDHRSTEDFALGYGAAAMFGNARRQCYFRQLTRLLAAHPELEGVWLPRSRLRTAPVALPLRPPSTRTDGPPPPGAHPDSDSPMAPMPAADGWHEQPEDAVTALAVVAAVAILWIGPRLIRRSLAHTEPVAGWRPVPEGLPPAGLQGFPWLPRNAHGAIDVSRYSATQWKASGLPYCPTCMTHAGQVNWNRLNFTWDPCPHGMIINSLRFKDITDLRRGRRPSGSPTPTGVELALWGLHTAPNSRTFITADQFDEIFQRIRQLLSVHPEFPGIWMSHEQIRSLSAGHFPAMPPGPSPSYERKATGHYVALTVHVAIYETPVWDPDPYWWRRTS